MEPEFSFLPPVDFVVSVDDTSLTKVAAAALIVIVLGVAFAAWMRKISK